MIASLSVCGQKRVIVLRSSSTEIGGDGLSTYRLFRSRLRCLRCFKLVCRQASAGCTEFRAWRFFDVREPGSLPPGYPVRYLAPALFKQKLFPAGATFCFSDDWWKLSPGRSGCPRGGRPRIDPDKNECIKMDDHKNRRAGARPTPAATCESRGGADTHSPDF